MTPTDEAKKLIAELPRIEQDGIVLPYIPEVDVESLVTRLLADKERLIEALREIVKGVDDWNKAVSKVIQIEEPHVWPGLEHARALIEKASHQP